MALVELVSVQTSDGLTLDGSLLRPEPGTQPSLGIDAVIMHHVKDGNFYSSPLFSHVQELLGAEGCAVLRVNNRGRDVIPSPGTRLPGGAREVIDECRIDFRAWLDYAEALGHRRVALWGHSLGAVKSAYYLATERDTRVACVIASSPPRLCLSAFLENSAKLPQPIQDRIHEDRARVQQRFDRGEPNVLLEAVPVGVTTPRHYLDEFSSDERYDVLRNLPSVKVPVLVTLGSQEVVDVSEVSLQGPSLLLFVSLNGLASEMQTLAARTPSIDFELIEGANHFYAGKYDELWSVVRRWLSQRIL